MKPKHSSSQNMILHVTLFFSGLMILTSWMVNPVQGSDNQLYRGQKLPDAILLGKGQKPVQLHDFQGRIKILSMVPQLNTPVCDEQTHRFSEQNGGLDQQVDFITISTNTSDDQSRFAEKANIQNMTFLSDYPSYDYGKKTGLLLPMHGILQRTVIVADQDNIIRHLEIVPMSQLPNFEAALEKAKKLTRPTGG